MPRHWTTNPYDGYTIGLVIANLEKLALVTVRGIHSDKRYRGHNCPTGSRSLSAARSGIPPRPFAARCDAELPWNP